MTAHLYGALRKNSDMKSKEDIFPSYIYKINYKVINKYTATDKNSKVPKFRE